MTDSSTSTARPLNLSQNKGNAVYILSYFCLHVDRFNFLVFLIFYTCFLVVFGMLGHINFSVNAYKIDYESDHFKKLIKFKTLVEYTHVCCDMLCWLCDNLYKGTIIERNKIPYFRVT